MSLELRSVSFAYAKGPSVVADFSLEVSGRETVGLVGPSGSGKSTLLALAGLLLRPDSGAVLIGGDEAWTRSSRFKTGSREISWVFQSLTSLSNRSALDNVAVALLSHGWSRGAATAAAESALDVVGLSSVGRRRIETLSGGQLQRVCVARAIAARPTMLIADEPTGQLDRKNSEAVAESLVAAGEAFEIPVLIATHDERVAARCHEVVRL